jgi:YD repeat-containing protein
LTETYPSYTGENIAYTYDSTSGSNKGIGHLTSFSDESGSTTQKFDNFGNMIQTVRTISGYNYTTSYSYDLANRVTEIIYPSGRYVDYTYDSSGYLTTVTTKPSSGGSVTTLAPASCTSRSGLSPRSPTATARLRRAPSTTTIGWTTSSPLTAARTSRT